MSHPRRRRRAEVLRAACEGVGLEIVCDPEPDGLPSASRTAALAWDSVDRAATHHLVLQDDIALCEGFSAQVRAAVSALPQAVLGFFAHWGSHVGSAIRLGALCELDWTEVVGCYLPTLAVVLPAEHARPLAKFMNASADTRDDMLIHQYLSREGISAYVSIPGLVEHLDIPSIVGNDRRGARHAACYLPAPGNHQFRGSAVLRPAVVPYINADNGSSQCFIQDGSPGMGGHYIPAGTALRDRGISPADLSRGLRGIAGARRGRSELTGGIEDGLLRGLYASSCLLGAIAAETRAGLRQGPAHSGAGTDQLLALPAVGAALSTMGPGTLRNLVSDSDLDQLAPSLTDVVEAGVRQGLAAARRTTYRIMPGE